MCIWLTSRQCILERFDFETSWKMFSQKGCVCNWFEITLVLEKYVVENDILFRNHLVGKFEILAEVMECYPSA